MIKTDVSKSEGKTYLECSIDIIDADNFILEMIKNNRIPGTASTTFVQIDSVITINYDISDMKDADSILRDSNSIFDLVDILDGISTTISMTGKYMLDINCLLLDMSYIFFDKRTRKTAMIVLPIENHENNIKNFMNESLLCYNFGTDSRSIEILCSLLAFVKSNENIDGEKLHLFLDQLKKKVKTHKNEVAYIVNEVTGEKIYLKTSKLSIGRHKGMCDYAIPSAKSLSRVHATLFREGDVWYLRDENSLNKSFINNQILENGKSRSLNEGDTFRLATEHFQFGYEELKELRSDQRIETQEEIKNAQDSNNQMPGKPIIAFPQQNHQQMQTLKDQEDNEEQLEDEIVPVSPEERITLYDLLSRFNLDRWAEYKRQRTIDKEIKEQKKRRSTHSGKRKQAKTADSTYAIPKKK